MTARHRMMMQVVSGVVRVVVVVVSVEVSGMVTIVAFSSSATATPSPASSAGSRRAAKIHFFFSKKSQSKIK